MLIEHMFDCQGIRRALLKAAQLSPQIITRHGEPIAVVISHAEYDRLVGAKTASRFGELRKGVEGSSKRDLLARKLGELVNLWADRILPIYDPLSA